jgi:hypothetical protein
MFRWPSFASKATFGWFIEDRSAETGYGGFARLDSELFQKGGDGLTGGPFGPELGDHILPLNQLFETDGRLGLEGRGCLVDHGWENAGLRRNRNCLSADRRRACLMLNRLPMDFSCRLSFSLGRGDFGWPKRQPFRFLHFRFGDGMCPGTVESEIDRFASGFLLDGCLDDRAERIAQTMGILAVQVIDAPQYGGGSGGDFCYPPRPYAISSFTNRK